MAAIISAKAIGQRRDELVVHVVLAQRSQGLDHQSADSTGSCHVLGSRLLENDFLVADFDFAFRAVSQEDNFRRNLIGESQQIGCVVARWLNPQTVLSRQRSSDLVGCRCEHPQLWVLFGIVIEPSRQTLDLLAVSEVLKGFSDC